MKVFQTIILLTLFLSSTKTIKSQVSTHYDFSVAAEVNDYYSNNQYQYFLKIYFSDLSELELNNLSAINLEIELSGTTNSAAANMEMQLGNCDLEGVNINVSEESCNVIIDIFNPQTALEQSSNQEYYLNLGRSGNINVVCPITVVDMDGTFDNNLCTNTQVEICFGSYSHIPPNNKVTTVTMTTEELIGGEYEFCYGESLEERFADNSEASTNKISNQSNHKFNVYPNPATEQITIQIQESQKINQVQIINNQGQTSFFSPNFSNDKLIISLHDFSKGVYLVKAIGEYETFTQRIIVP